MRCSTCNKFAKIIEILDMVALSLGYLMVFLSHLYLLYLVRYHMIFLGDSLQQFFGWLLWGYKSHDYVAMEPINKITWSTTLLHIYQASLGMKYPQHPRCTPCPLLLLNTSSLSWMQATLLITSLLSLVSTPALSLGFALSTALTLPKPLEVDLPSLLPPMFAMLFVF